MSEEVIESLKKAEAAKYAAEAEAARQLAKFNAAQARKWTLDADLVAIDLRKKERDERKELARDTHHHVYLFADGVSKSSVQACIVELTHWMRTDPGCAIEIIFDSPGGSVIDGMHLWDFLTRVKSKGHHLTTVALGMAASMAGILLQAGDVRVMGRESYLLIHEISFGAGGKIGEVEDTVEMARKMCERVLDIFANRSGGKVTRAYIKKHWARKDWWIDSTEAKRLGFVDEVL